MSGIGRWRRSASALAIGVFLSGAIVAQTKTNQRQVVPATSSSSGSLGQNAGVQYALVIGIAKYQSLPKLGTPVSDAQEVDKVLRESYGFKTQLLVDATRDQIIAALDNARRTLTQDDSLLIYYAGHGFYDKSEDQGYWAPVDAGQDTYAHWIIATELTSRARAISARHVLIISDSCYSGKLARDVALTDRAADVRGPFLARMLEDKSRDLMSSGGNEPVSDSDTQGHGDHSVFANALLRGLRQMEFREFAASELFDLYVKIQVPGRSRQQPEYTPIGNSGHEGGDFVFFRKGEGAIQSVGERQDLPPTPRVNPDEDAIHMALSQYQDAYASMDIDILKRIWPTLSKDRIRGLQSGFDGAKAVMVELRNPAISVNGETATVTADQWMKWTRDRHQQPPQVNPVDVQLKKTAEGTWLISGVRGR